jgi:hypothetical protein
VPPGTVSVNSVSQLVTNEKSSLIISALDNLARIRQHVIAYEGESIQSECPVCGAAVGCLFGRTMKPLGVGVVGAGHWGERHAYAYHHLPQARLVGICDIDQPRAEFVAERYRAERVYQHLERLEPRSGLRLEAKKPMSLSQG